MGVSTDGQISFGILFDEGYVFPWDINDSGEFDDDIKVWWRRKQGFRHSFEIYTPEGGYIDGKRPSEERITAYYKERDDFNDAHPLPAVELVNCCSRDCPMYILAIAGSVGACSRGYPQRFQPADLQVTPDQVRELLEFCKAHGIKYEDDPAWYLSSYWG